MSERHGEPGRWVGPVEGVADELLLLGESEAVEAYCDELNRRRLRGFLWLFVVVGALYGLVMSLAGQPLLAVLGGGMALADLVLLRLSRAPAALARVRPVAAAAVLLHFVALNLLHPGVDAEGLGLWYLALAVLAARLRLAVGEQVALLGTLYALLAVRVVLVNTVLLRQRPPVGELVGFAVVGLVVLAAATGFAYRDRRRFLLRFRAETSRHRERLRMKQELEHARSIQLSMLPRAAPEPGWLDIAALSLPATEVGGDYYDYFQLAPDRLAVVVGDVTGHGVASGLVLSGVRAGLNLLEGDMHEPAAVLARVNRMVKRISPPRLLMTMGLVLLDRERREVVVVTAGHPPVLHLRAAEGRLDELGRGALPLGALADTTYAEVRAGLAPGDLLLAYSDGVVEAVDPSGEQLGWERLRRALVEAAAGPRARDVRDALLRAVWEWKGEAEQVDDVTMVVVRVTG